MYSRNKQYCICHEFTDPAYLKTILLLILSGERFPVRNFALRKISSTHPPEPVYSFFNREKLSQ